MIRWDLYPWCVWNGRGQMEGKLQLPKSAISSILFYFYYFIFNFIYFLLFYFILIFLFIILFYFNKSHPAFVFPISSFISKHSLPINPWISLRFCFKLLWAVPDNSIPILHLSMPKKKSCLHQIKWCSWENHGKHSNCGIIFFLNQSVCNYCPRTFWLLPKIMQYPRKNFMDFTHRKYFMDFTPRKSCWVWGGCWDLSWFWTSHTH